MNYFDKGKFVLSDEDRVESLDKLAESLARNRDEPPDLIGQQKPSMVLAQSREFLHAVMEYYWNEASTNAWDPTTELTQNKIFTYFMDFMSTRINEHSLEPQQEGETRESYLKEALLTWIGNRDSTLIKYTNELNKAILGKHPRLITKRYLIVKAKSVITGKVGERIVPVDSYQNEQSIDQLLDEQKEKYYPKIENAEPGDLEVLSVSNAIGYFEAMPPSEIENMIGQRNPRRVRKKKLDEKEFDYRDDFKMAEYLMLCRNKRGPREEEKFVDWISGLRLMDEFPYDGIGVTIVCPHENEIYQMREIAKEITIGTAEKRKQNRYDIHGNLPSRYSKGEFKKIIKAMKEAQLVVVNKMKINRSYIPSAKEYETLARWFADKQVIDMQRIETQFLSKYISSIRDEPGAPLYHSGPYYAKRKNDREEKILNPAMTVSRDDKYRVRDAKAPKPKPKIDLIIQYLEDFWSDVFVRTQRS